VKNSLVFVCYSHGTKYSAQRTVTVIRLKVAHSIPRAVNCVLVRGERGGCSSFVNTSVISVVRLTRCLFDVKARNTKFTQDDSMDLFLSTLERIENIPDSTSNHKYYCSIVS